MTHSDPVPPSDPTQPSAPTETGPPPRPFPGDISGLEEQITVLVRASDDLLSMLGRQTTQGLLFASFLLSLAWGAFPLAALMWRTHLSEPEYVSTTIVGGVLALASVWLLVRDSSQVSATLGAQLGDNLKTQAELQAVRERRMRGETAIEPDVEQPGTPS